MNLGIQSRVSSTTCVSSKPELTLEVSDHFNLLIVCMHVYYQNMIF